MLFRHLNTSAALDLERYRDIDHFHDSERYVRADSVPLRACDFSVLRATLAMPSTILSLVRTFPRIITGFELSGRLLIVLPMDGVTSARINGDEIGQSLLLLKGSPNCTIYEPEGRLVAILSIRPEALDGRWPDIASGHLLLRLPPPRLARLKMLVGSILETAAEAPDAMRDMLGRMEEALLAVFCEATWLSEIRRTGWAASATRYKAIVDRVDDIVYANPAGDLSCERIAEAIGISVRTLQTAAQSVCGSGVHQYSRLRRLWSVHRHLRTGPSGLTVKASALAYGFSHMGEFSAIYHAVFGELPSQTLASAKLGGGAPERGARCGPVRRPASP